jgi:diguanylate cyclase (GGDEF)-like protein
MQNGYRSRFGVPMDLDIRTMMVMTALQSLLLAGLLALVSMHVENMRGVRAWALSELAIGVSLGLAYTQLTPGNSWIVVVGAGVLVLGLNFQLIGNLAFCKRAVRWHWMGLSTGLAVILNIIFVVLYPDIPHRVICNSLILAALSMANAYVLFRHDEPPIRAALWFTGGGFGLLSSLLILRAAYVAIFPAHDYGLYAQIAINPATFFVVCVVQLILVIGFVLMMHYRIAHDLKTLAARDGLTGALNRRRLEEEFEHLRALYLRGGGSLAVMMIDVDHFKAINDQYGHLVGDEVLRRLAALTESTIRKQDYFARYGGEEFCILMPATTEQDALLIAERLRQSYAEMPMDGGDAPWFSTISIGVADATLAGFEFDTLIAAADSAMYAAKMRGRNRVVSYSSL